MPTSNSTLAAYEANAAPYSRYLSERGPSRHLAAFRRHLPDLASVLDIGCANGVDTAQMCHLGLRATGVDLSPKLIEIAQSEYPATKYPGIAFQDGDVERLPFDNASFDGVWARAVLHHLPDPTLALGEIARVLQPEGILFVQTRANSGNTHPARGWSGNDEREYYGLGAEALCSLMREQGFRPIVPITERASGSRPDLVWTIGTFRLDI